MQLLLHPPEETGRLFGRIHSYPSIFHPNFKQCVNVRTLRPSPLIVLCISPLFTPLSLVSYFLSLFCSILPLSPGVATLKEAVQLSQLEAPPTEAEQHDPGPVNAPPAADDTLLLLLPTSVAAAARVSMETSSSRAQTSKLEVEEEEEEVEESSSEALTISELVYRFATHQFLMMKLIKYLKDQKMI